MSEREDDRDRGFDAFVAARSGALIRTAYLVTGHQQAAEDLLQTALAKTYLAWHRIDDPSAVEAYVRRTMITTNISWWRRHKGREAVTDSPPERTTERRFDDDAADQDQLWRALRTLPDRQRAVLVLRYYEDLDETEIARLMGCSRGSVKTHASRGLSSLRGLFADEMPAASRPAVDQEGSAR